MITTEERDAKLVRQITHCVSGSFYRDLFEELSIDPESISTVGDLERLPILVTPKIHRQLQEESSADAGHPFGSHLTVDPSDVVSVSSTSGTTGDPTFYAFTNQDVTVTDTLWQRALKFIGVRPGDRVLHGFGLSMYLAGIPLVRAMERMGLTPIPIGAEAGTEKLLRMMQLTRPTVLACTPSYAEHLLERAPEVLGKEAAELGIEKIVCAGEPGAGLPAVRNKLQEGWGATVYDMLGGAHGIMMASCGHPDCYRMHVLADDYSVSTDLVDPTTKEPLEIVDGITGERVKTSLEWQAQPPLRYSVGDVYQVFTSPCEKGIAGKTIRVMGRVDDLLIVKGVKLYPAAVKNVVNGFVPEVTGELRIVLDGPPPRVTPPLRLTIEAAADSADEDSLRDRIATAMHNRLTVRPEITLVPAGSLARSSHKSQLVEILDGGSSE
ncbi:MAG: phenylacetate--CoA ligase [bacterium]|nr:phenylacetate--CoA ligase [bacterium]